MKNMVSRFLAGRSCFGDEILAHAHGFSRHQRREIARVRLTGALKVLDRSGQHANLQIVTFSNTAAALKVRQSIPLSRPFFRTSNCFLVYVIFF
jgi:hypothetical protein